MWKKVMDILEKKTIDKIGAEVLRKYSYDYKYQS